MRLSLSLLNGTGKVGESFYHLHVILQSLLGWLYGKVLSCKMFNDSGMVINTSSKKKRLMVRNIDSLTFYLIKKVILYEISSVARRCVNYGFCLITLHLKAFSFGLDHT